MPPADHTRRDRGIRGAEHDGRDGGEPRGSDVGDDAERDPAERETPPVPPRDIDLVDYAQAAAFDQVERGPRLVGGYRSIHASLTFRAGKSGVDFPSGKSNGGARINSGSGRP
jgi:hypothetical protein